MDEFDEDGELSFLLSNTTPKQSQLNPEIKKFSLHKQDGKSGRQVSDVCSPSGQNSSIQKGKTVLYAKASKVNSPMANAKAPASVADQLKHSSQHNATTVVKEEKLSTKPVCEPETDWDFEDDKSLCFKFSAGLSKGNSNQGTSRLGSSPFPTPRPITFKYSTLSTSKSYDSVEDKQVALNLHHNDSTISDELRKYSIKLNKRPPGEVKSSGHSSVKKAKFSYASTPISGKQVSVRADPKAADDDGHASIFQRKPMEETKKAKYSRPSKVSAGSGERQKRTSLFNNGAIFLPPYKPHGVKMLYKGQPVDLTPEQEQVATMHPMIFDTDYMNKPKFKENFMSVWRKILGENHVIQNIEDCDFTPIYQWHLRENDKKKQASTEVLAGTNAPSPVSAPEEPKTVGARQLASVVLALKGVEQAVRDPMVRNHALVSERADEMQVEPSEGQEPKSGRAKEETETLSPPKGANWVKVAGRTERVEYAGISRPPTGGVTALRQDKNGPCGALHDNASRVATSSTSILPAAGNRSGLVAAAATPEATQWRGYLTSAHTVPVLNRVAERWPQTFANFACESGLFQVFTLDVLANAVKAMERVELSSTSSTEIATFRKSLNDLKKHGFDVSWMEARLDVVADSMEKILEVRAVTDKIAEAQRVLHHLEADERRMMVELSSRFGEFDQLDPRGTMGQGLL